MTSTVYKFGVRFEGSAAGLAKAAKEAETAMRQVGARSATEFRKQADARKTLGVRSEREIQREIQRTEAAYNRLARAGAMSWDEQRMAARKMREEVTRLNNEMGRMTTRQKVAFGARAGLAVGAGAGLATAMIAPRVQRTMDYDRRLASMANTAYAGQGVAGRRAGMRDLDRMLVDAVRFGGGSRDNAATTAETLLGAGIFKPGQVGTILRQAVRAGTANSADSALFAQMAVTGNQTMGISPDRMGAMFGMGTYAGQQGGFEIRDMAKWLPSQMAAAKAVGMYGEGGFAKLAALNQAAAVTAGTRDEAGNNVVNLLAKLGSQDTAKDFRKQGIDLPRQLAEGRMKGLDAIDVLGNLLQQQLGKDKNYQAVQRQLAGAKNDEERSKALQAVGGIAEGTMIGKVFQDRQALMALYGFMQNRGRVDEIARGAMGNTDAADRNFELISSTSSYKVEQAKNEAEIAQTNSLLKLTPAIDSLADGTARLVREYPMMTTAVVAATAALTALAGSAAAAALMNGGKIPGLPGGFGGGGGGAGGAAGKAAGGGRFGMLGKLGALGGLATVAAGMFYTSPEEIATLKQAEALKNGRGNGFNDPRLLGMPSASERLGGAGGTSLQPLLEQQLKGEILVRVTGAPGLGVEAETRSSDPRIPFRTDTGRTNLAAGF